MMKPLRDMATVTGNAKDIKYQAWNNSLVSVGTQKLSCLT